MKNRSCHQRFGERWFSGSFVDQHCWHDRMDEICKIDRTRCISPKKHTSCTNGFGDDGQSRSKISRKLFMVWNFTATWREIVERKPSTCKTNQTSGWSGTDDKGKGKIGTGKGKGEPGKGKGKSKNKGKVNNRAKRGRKGFLEMKGARRQARNTNRSKIQRVDEHELGSR